MADDQMPEDDAVIVEEPVTEEQANDELVEKVTKLLHAEDTPDEPSEKPAEEAEDTGEAEVPEFTDELKSRAQRAGLSDEMAQQLHQSGQLREIITAMNTKLNEYVQSKNTEEDKGQREEEPQPKDQEPPDLDPDVFPEEYIQRDAYFKQRIGELEAMFNRFVQAQEQGGPEFDNWVDESITKLGGNPKDEDDCQQIFKVYENLCQAFGIDPKSQAFDVMDQAYDVVHPEKMARKTVDRLRDSEGKFISPKSASKGGPPPKPPTEEEAHDALVSRVTTYLKEQGVQMSGY